MISAKLIELIEIHAGQLASDVVNDLTTNKRTPGFHTLPREFLTQRIFQIYHHLGNWIGEPKNDRVETEFAEWGRRRFDQGIALSEILYTIIILKHHLRRYIADHGLIDASFPLADSDYVLPMHLHSLQDLNVRVGEFFDEALYHFSRGYEAGASAASGTAIR